MKNAVIEIRIYSCADDVTCYHVIGFHDIHFSELFLSLEQKNAPAIPGRCPGLGGE